MKTKFINPHPDKLARGELRVHAHKRLDKAKARGLPKVLTCVYIPPHSKNPEAYFNCKLNPEDSVRIYLSPGAQEPYRIEFVHRCEDAGVIFIITTLEWARELFDKLNQAQAF